MAPDKQFFSNIRCYIEEQTRKSKIQLIVLVSLMINLLIVSSFSKISAEMANKRFEKHRNEQQEITSQYRDSSVLGWTKVAHVWGINSGYAGIVGLEGGWRSMKMFGISKLIFGISKSINFCSSYKLNKWRILEKFYTLNA